MDDGEGCAVVVVFACLLCFIAFMFGCEVERHTMQSEIVDHGCAEYYLDENHKAQWRWKGAEHE